MNIINPMYELIDPTPNIHELFVLFSDQLFYGALGACTIEWSKKMTTCAGVCSFNNKTGFCSIRLSEPLLKYRLRKDLIETLLHEMIHAYLFTTERIQNRDGHGILFQQHMHRINAAIGTNITIYHSFHAEVALYKQHWWQCNGPCQNRAPFFGLIKRSINRSPGPNDFWWLQHQKMCFGTFIKVKEPNNKKKLIVHKNAKKIVKKEFLKKTNEKLIKINTLFPKTDDKKKNNLILNGNSDQSKKFFSNNGYVLKSSEIQSLNNKKTDLHKLNQVRNNLNKKSIDIVYLD